MSFVPKVHSENGGDELVVESGGDITIKSGGVINMQTGALFQIAGANPTAIADLTAASGTANDTVTDVGAAFNQATLNDNFKDLATKVNAILARLREVGINV